MKNIIGGIINEKLLSEYDSFLEEINYNKMWEDLSKGDKDFLYGFTSQKDNKAITIIENSKISKNSYSKYRNKLIIKEIRIYLFS